MVRISSEQFVNQRQVVLGGALGWDGQVIREIIILSVEGVREHVQAFGSWKW